MKFLKQVGLLVALLLVTVFSLRAQSAFNYGNGWYVSGQPYLKLQVWEDGIYRVRATDLAAAGFNVSPADLAQLQVFYRGVEQYIHVQTQGGNFDYLEFYGRHNDGREDSIFYRSPNTNSVHDPTSQPNIRRSLWTDTSTYYLTIGVNPGRRVQVFNDQNYGNYSPEPFFPTEIFFDYPPVQGMANYVGGGGSEYDVRHLLNSYYITGEGYVGIALAYNSNLTIPMRTPQAANLGTPATFSVRMFGQSTTRHDFVWTIDGHQMLRDTTSGIYLRTRSVNYPHPIGTTTNIVYNALGTDNNNTDNNAFIFQTLQYDRLFNMEGTDSAWVVGWQKGSNAYFRFTNTAPTTQVLGWDVTNNMRCIGSGNGSNAMDLVVPGAQNKRTIIVAGESEIKTPLLKAAALSNLTDLGAGAEFIIITHPDLMMSANAYKLYRDTCTVNQLNTRVVTVNEIYDEFGYGSITPMAIKRFCKYAHDNWTTKPKFFMLWGKGQYETRFHPLNLVPTFGYPASDYEYVSDYDYNAINVKPETPIGRVNIYNNQEGLEYLNKVNTYEHTPFAGWMKELVFLGGGNDTTEQKPILSYLRSDYKPVAEGAPFGGHVNYYQKFNTGIVTNSNLTSTQRINEGSSIIHFFGHSSSNIYDVDIQEPVLYQNYQKMPLMVAFGCYGGNFTGDTKSFGERFVLQSERGSIGYLANSTAGFLAQLGNFGITFYDNFYNKQYGQPIGVILQEAIGDFFSRWSDENSRNHAKQLNLQCDPSIVINSPDKPDLAIGPEDIYFTPDGFSASDPGFDINVITHNYGRVTQDSFYLSVRQLLPSGTWLTYPKVKFPPVLNVDTLRITLPNTIGNEMAGLNSFDVFVDSTALITEISEDNNRVYINVVIPGNSPAILYPYPYAIIPSNTVKLAASSYVLNNLPVVRYQYEIDSVPDFSSPLKAVSPVITGTSTYSEWQVPFTLQDSGVYYWRVRLADNYPAAWSNASFKYIVDRRGWAQSQAPQFTADEKVRITLDEVNREWNFGDYSVDLAAHVAEGDFAAYRLANGAFESSLNPTPAGGIKATPIRALDLIPSIQNTVHGDWAFYAFPDGQFELANTINSMPVGDYFFAVSEADPQAQNWSRTLMTAFHNLGIDSTRMRHLPGKSFIILARKGYPGQAILIDQPNVYDVQQNLYRLDLRVALHTAYPAGTIGSTTIGPVRDWNQLYWNWGGMEPFGKDDVEVSVYAASDQLHDSLVYQGLARGFTGLSAIDADRYPYMHLKAYVEDSAKRTAAQMDHWHVFYTPVPDVAVDAVTDWAFNQDTLSPGQAGSVDFSALNVSDFDMDSLLVRFAIRKADRSVVELGTRRYGPLAAHQARTLHHDFSIPNSGVSGNVRFIIELNPGPDQPEQHFFNNLYQHPFYVLPDVIQPILDVTVDGKHLMDGDIVSPLPEILFEVNDENRYLAVNDTAFEVYFGLKTPNPASLPRVFIGGNGQMETQPASLPANKARLYFRPGRLADGEYTLRVQGYDQAGNAAGKTKYEINFEVVNESALSNVLNYPNPFSTSTRFAYTMTGSEIPEVFQIHIYTITGRLVKVIDLHETNDVRIGRNLTDYTWDGRDEYGDLLANGVYVYRVVAKTNGSEMKNRDEGVTRMFDNGYGKMYIMR
jgi:hypothetical protein